VPGNPRVSVNRNLRCRTGGEGKGNPQHLRIMAVLDPENGMIDRKPKPSLRMTESL
jgi:hypothetical protein